ncbi:hypothetical protein KIN20_038236 [Parelaphostrongylus tenuis]|uniref:Uncharacterized protein n=1 Tax=Parelaphostrongylus tenuis TaxID=148309 RepID=A0AAD5REL5_PARTN|nr:hypothetical protein KIN20_038236 [Parelaphostrongylus tenuis]
MESDLNRYISVLCIKFAIPGSGGKSEYAVISFDVLITVDFITHESSNTAIR